MTAAPTSRNPAIRCQAGELIPRQRQSTRALRIATDSYIQWMVKHPYLTEFHSRPEWLYAGLLEGNARVISYVPQPFVLQVGKRRYTPDCFVLEGGERRVVELKPRGEFDEALRGPLEAFFAVQGMTFEVVSNESIYERAIEAETWLNIIRVLHLNREINTVAAEQDVLNQIPPGQVRRFDDLTDPGDRPSSRLRELAALRLLHRGLLKGEFTARPLDYDTELTRS